MPATTSGAAASAMLKCAEPTCDKDTEFLSWQDGSIKRYNPRYLYGKRGHVLLVCKIYRCSKGHFTTSSDHNFLLQIQIQLQPPFFCCTEVV